MTASIADAAAELKKVYKILSADVEESRTYGQSNPSAFAHRTLIRTFFALVEGLTYQMRKYALVYAEHDVSLLTRQEIVLLNEEKYSLDKHGKIKITADFHKSLSNVLFSIACFAKVHRVSFQPDISNHGWGAMQQLVAIRNALTHPKSAAGLELLESQILIAEQAALWWNNTFVQLFEICQKTS